MKNLKHVLLTALLSPLVAMTAANAQQANNDAIAFEKAFNVKLPSIKSPVFKKDTFDVASYGAKADGITLNTKAINDAILACSKNGGGVVLLGDGLWLSGPIILQNNVNLHLKENAVLLFTADKSQYKLIEANWEGKKAIRNESPISGTNLQNIAITGKGIIDGNGDVWRAVKKEKLTESQWKKLVASGGVVKDGRYWMPSAGFLKGDTSKNASAIVPGKSLADYEEIKDFFRPNLLVLTNCKTILLEDVTFQNSPAWCLHPLMCEDLTLRNLMVKNPWYAQNGDGVDVESCKNVLIEGSSFDVGDDGICIKSGRDEDGRKRGMPTENVIVRNNVVYHAHGGFVIGSEMSGGAKNLYVYNNSFMGTDIGLRFKTTRGRGGVVENIYISHTNMKDIAGEAILFDMYYMAKDPILLAGEKREDPKSEMMPVTEATPQFKNFFIKNTYVNGAEKALFIRGLPEMNIKNINIENSVIQADAGIELVEAQGISIKNMSLLTRKSSNLISIRNSSAVNFDGFKALSNYQSFAEIAGAKTANINFINTPIKDAKQKSTFSFGAKPSVLNIK
ncbi:glycoside hydrolase family 28 protein [Pelobium manganitolerans]|uniref:glycoside hydrolase family 28 protein n=1 Tax=Pelobium manganitolerans TaxID=1842495 RepID=UPI003FA34E04